MKRWAYNRLTDLYDMALWPEPVDKFLCWLRYDVFYPFDRDDWL